MQPKVIFGFRLPSPLLAPQRGNDSKKSHKGDY